MSGSMFKWLHHFIFNIFRVVPTPFCVEGSTLRSAIQFCFRRGKQWAFPKDSNLRNLAQTPELPVAVINLLFRQILQPLRSEEHTSELQSRGHLVCRLLLEKK